MKKNTKEKIEASLVWKALFQAMKRHCTHCGKDFECYYTCEEVDKKQDRARKETIFFCYCPHCYEKDIAKFGNRSRARKKCHLLDKE